MTIDGETSIPNRWTKCRICGAPTSQPPVCSDLLCEMEFERREVESW